MTHQYPEKTCSLDRLVRNKKSVQAALLGEKTEQRRNGVYGYPGEEFTLGDKKFVITQLEQQNLGEMSDKDAIQEGYSSMEAYKNFILKMHKGMQWQPESKVWKHSFKRL